MVSSFQKILVYGLVMFVITALLPSLSCAQPLQTSLQVDSLLSSYISEWNQYQSITLQVKNVSDSTVVFRLESTILLQGKPLATVPSVATERVVLAPHADTTLPSAHIFPVLKMNYADKQHLDKRIGMISRGGELSICVNLFDTTGLHGLAPANCVHRNIYPYLIPELVKPVNNDSLNPSSTYTFYWNSVRPKPRRCYYTLRAYNAGNEIYPAQVVRTAMPIVDTTVIDTTLYTWHAPDSLRGARIVWQVHSTDGNGAHYGGNDGYSTINQFVIRTQAVKPSAQKQSSIKTSAQKTGVSKKVQRSKK